MMLRARVKVRERVDSILMSLFSAEARGKSGYGGEGHLQTTMWG